MSVSLICASMATAIRGITPILHSDEKFTEHDSSTSFIEFCERNPIFRRFFVRGTGDVEIGTAMSDLEWVTTEVEVAVCYPRDFRAGDQMGNDRDALIESDLWQIDHTVGTAGYSTLETAVSGSVLTLGQRREELEACVYGVLRLQVSFWRATP